MSQWQLIVDQEGLKKQDFQCHIGYFWGYLLVQKQLLLIAAALCIQQQLSIFCSEIIAYWAIDCFTESVSCHGNHIWTLFAILTRA